jgi:hypothetical protein
MHMVTVNARPLGFNSRSAFSVALNFGALRIVFHAKRELHTISILLLIIQRLVCPIALQNWIFRQSSQALSHFFFPFRKPAHSLANHYIARNTLPVDFAKPICSVASTSPVVMRHTHIPQFSL